MKIEQARRLTIGAQVQCPTDRGDPAYIGRVRDGSCATAEPQTHCGGAPFIWVRVKGPHGYSIWPSNRLGVI